MGLGVRGGGNVTIQSESRAGTGELGGSRTEGEVKLKLKSNFVYVITRRVLVRVASLFSFKDA